ncbi:MAG: hypothetical protein B7Z45_10700, partial [Azorhizobium sp. 12-66-6]
MTATPEANRPRSADQDAAASAAAFLERAVGRARWSILWERTWPPLLGLGIVLAAFLAASWAGLWLHLPPLGRIAGVAIFAALVSDALATRPDDPVGAALWRAHLTRTLSRARALKAGFPAPGMAARDPRAFRALAVLALVASFFVATGDHLGRISTAFDWRGAVVPTPYRLDAWVDPPGYTGRPPVVLAGLRSDDPTVTHQASAFSVPAGSTLVVRSVGLDPAALKIEGGLTEVVQDPAPDAAKAAPAAAPSAPPRLASAERRFTISGAGSVSFTGPDQRSLMWRFTATPDSRPQISFAKEPAAGPRNALVLAYRIEDDYGATQASAVFAPAPPERAFFARPDAPAPVAATPLVAAPDFPLTLPPSGGK